MRRFLPIIWFISFIGLGACGQSRQNPTPLPEISGHTEVSAKDNFPAGVVIPKVACLSDATNTYALYLPGKMKAGLKYPVVFFFDAHARGTMPLSKYAVLADRYGFILVASNNSKNGMDASSVLNISTAFFKDVFLRLPADSRNVFCAGFSGGARVAVGLAMQNLGIKGVIANSAGFNPKQEPLQRGICFVGLVGNEDFNLAEMKSTQVALNDAGNVNDLLIFNGKHDWAPVNDMDKAFLLLSLEGIREKRMQKNDSVVNASYLADEREAAKILNGKTDVLTKAAACHLMTVYYEGVKPVEKYNTELQKIYGSQAYRDARAKENQMSNQEQIRQEAYGKKIQEKDMAWWVTEVNRIEAENKSSKDREHVDENKRLLAYLSLVSFMNANAALNQNAHIQAEQFLALYRLVDPSNSEWAYLLACLRMRQNDIPHALEALGESVKLGFNDVDRARAQKEFQPLLSDEKFNEILAGIKQ
ncbi:MAG TPA: hypothetical protein VGO45_05140, partial [Bacteroidia bacterium]|nr:hypothetical protein [Bacteroidia bacterium]